MHGRGGNAEYWQPNRFLLNYQCGAVDAHEQITKAWNKFKTLEEAEEVAASARAAKDQHKVAHSRRIAQKRNISRVAQNVPAGCTKCTRKGQVSGCTKCTYRARCTKCTHCRNVGWWWGTWRKVSKEPQCCNASGRTLRIADVERAGSD
jgi:hypothetical protein